VAHYGIHKWLYRTADGLLVELHGGRFAVPFESAVPVETRQQVFENVLLLNVGAVRLHYVTAPLSKEEFNLAWNRYFYRMVETATYFEIAPDAM
jgi:hypothetical protein